MCRVREADPCVFLEHQESLLAFDEADEHAGLALEDDYSSTQQRTCTPQEPLPATYLDAKWGTIGGRSLATIAGLLCQCDPSNAAIGYFHGWFPSRSNFSSPPIGS